MLVEPLPEKAGKSPCVSTALPDCPLSTRRCKSVWSKARSQLLVGQAGGEQGSVVPEERHGTVGTKRHLLVEGGEEIRLQADGDDTEQGPRRRYDLAGDEKTWLAAQAAVRGRAERRGIGLDRHSERFPIGDVAGGRWPDPRCVYDVAVGSDDQGNAYLRLPDDAIAHDVEKALLAHDLAELLFRLDMFLVDPVDHALHDQVGRPLGLAGVRGDREGNGLSRRLRAVDSALVIVLDDQPHHAPDQQDVQDTARDGTAKASRAFQRARARTGHRLLAISI